MRKLAWCAFQLAIIIPIMMFADTHAAMEGRATTSHDVMIALLLGIGAAAAATMILSKIFELLGRRIGRQQSARQNGGLVIPPGSQFLNPPNTLWSGHQQLRKAVGLRPQPKALHRFLDR